MLLPGWSATASLDGTAIRNTCGPQTPEARGDEISKFQPQDLDGGNGALVIGF